MAIKLTSLRADTRRENDGDWIEIPDLPGVSLKVRGTAYGPFQTARSLLLAKWARKYPRDVPPANVEYEGNGRLYADHILLGWRGFASDDGADLPYDAHTAEQILLDPAYRELHEHIRYAMTRVSQVETEYVEAAAGNSERSSDNNSKSPRAA